MKAKKVYVSPHLTTVGAIQLLTQGPIVPSINDGLIGQGTNPNIGCQPSDFNGPDYKLCS